MRKRTFLDKKFSAGDANSQAFRDNWEATFGTSARDAADKQDAEPTEQCMDCGAEIQGAHGHCPGVPGGFSDD